MDFIGYGLSERFELFGYWWEPDSECHRNAGVLRFDQETGIRLDLLRQVTPRSMRDTLGRGLARRLSVPTIHGLVEGGWMVTLFDNEVWPDHITVQGIDKLRVESALMLIGQAHLANVSDMKFEKAYLRYTHLEEWSGVPVFSRALPDKRGRADGPQAMAAYDPPDNMKLQIPDRQTTVQFTNEFQSGGDEKHFLSWEHWMCIGLLPETAQGWEWYSDTIWSVAEWLLLLSWGPVIPARVVVYSSFLESGQAKDHSDESGDAQAFEVYWHLSGLEQEQLARTINPLFSYRSLQGPCKGTLEQWFARRNRMQATVQLFGETFLYPSTSPVFNFLGITQALEAFHRDTFGGQYHHDQDYEVLKEILIKSIPAEANKDWSDKFINGELRYGNQFTLRRRMKDLFGELESSLSALITEDVKGFIDKVVKTRNYYTHWDEKSKAEAWESGALLLGYEVLRLLLGVLLLKQIGVSDFAIVGALRNHTRLSSILSTARKNL